MEANKRFKYGENIRLKKCRNAESLFCYKVKDFNIQNDNIPRKDVVSFTILFQKHHIFQKRFAYCACLFSKLFLFFIVFNGTISTCLSFPRLCSDPEPIDLLAHALSDTRTLPEGVDIVKDESNVKGYRFDTAARLLGTDNGELFPYCNKFPAEFSLILTFQHHAKRATNEFIMTLLGQDRHTILLAARLQRDRLTFDYASKTGKRASISIKSPVLSDGEWHTVIITVTTNRVKFTLDCTTPKNRKLETPFPKRLNIKGTKIYVASRRIKRKRFTGLLRQIILLPGADASVGMCPSENPALATLDRESQHSVSPLRMSRTSLRIVFEEDTPDASCSQRSRGNMMYTKEMQMKLCTGNAFVPIRGGRERMDYVIDYEDIITDYQTLSIEHFIIPGEGNFIATANNNDMVRNRSHIFQWNGKEFVLFQSVKTQAAMMWKFFQIGYEYFLAVANYGGSNIRSVTNVIYRWSGKNRKFMEYQNIITKSASSIEVFSIDMMYFLVIATPNSVGNGPITTMTNQSPVYKWNSDLKKFVQFTFVPTSDPLDLEFFRIALSPHMVGSCMVIANAFDGTSSHVQSDIYCWNPMTGSFTCMQRINTVGASDWEFFEFEDRYFLAVANNFDRTASSSSDSSTVNSTIYELNLELFRFLPYQQIETYGAKDWEYFTIGNQRFLIVSNSVSSTSDVYRWQGVEKFVKVHSLPTDAATDFDYISMDGDHYLASANSKGVLSKLFKIVTY